MNFRSLQRSKSDKDFFQPLTRKRDQVLTADILKLLECPGLDLSAAWGVIIGRSLPDSPLYDVDMPYWHYLAGRQAEALYHKNEDLVMPGVDPRRQAISTYLESEHRCYEFSRACRRPGGLASMLGSDLLFQVRRKISLVLGEVPPLSSLALRFGPGAATTCTKNTSARFKLSSEPGISESARGYVRDLQRMFPRWLGNSTIHVGPARLSFVPKSYKTHRPIEVQPLLNSFVQIGIGSFLKTRLQRFGIDLTDQTRNQGLARAGSLSGEFATIDLSSASDSVSCQLVWELLPQEWFDFLWAWRCSQVTYKEWARPLQLEKFSAMGCGFTFELESLIFYAVTAAVCGNDSVVSVYGDDIICPTVYASSVIQALESCGFVVNTDKTFISGPFRESCGADWLNGYEVRPWYKRGTFSKAKLVSFHNFLARKGRWEHIQCYLKGLPELKSIPFGDSEGDGHLYSSEYDRLYPGDGSEGWFHPTLVAKPRRVTTAASHDHLLPTFLLGLNEDEEYNTAWRVAGAPFDCARPDKVSDAFVERALVPPEARLIRVRKLPF